MRRLRRLPPFARLLLAVLVLAGLVGLATQPGTAADEPLQEKRRPTATRDDDLERFEPSEDVPADSAVSFPVDI